MRLRYPGSALVWMLAAASCASGHERSGHPAAAAHRAQATPDWTRLAAAVDSLARTASFSGVVLVAREGNVVFERAYGLAQREPDVPMTTQTRFQIASIGKMFTSVAILQLADEGRLSLDQTVQELAPGLLRDSVARRVTVRQLLNHTSGISDIATPMIQARWRLWLQSAEAARYRPVPVQEVARRSTECGELVPRLMDVRLEAEPAARWRYNNTGFLVLGKIVESVSKRDFESYLRERVFRPAGMRSTDEVVLPRAGAATAIGYAVVDAAGVKHMVPTFPASGSSCSFGGNSSTASDLARFAHALRDGRLISPRSFGQMVSTVAVPGSPGYGLGAQIFHEAEVAGHSGGTRGINHFLQLHLKTGYDAVVLSNVDLGGERLRPHLEAVLRGT